MSKLKRLPVKKPPQGELLTPFMFHWCHMSQVYIEPCSFDDEALYRRIFASRDGLIGTCVTHGSTESDKDLSEPALSGHLWFNWMENSLPTEPSFQSPDPRNAVSIDAMTSLRYNYRGYSMNGVFVNPWFKRPRAFTLSPDLLAHCPDWVRAIVPA